MELKDNSFLKTQSTLDMVFCSDGGVQANQAGFGLVGSIDGTVVAQCHQRLHKIYNDYNSHRSEAWGIVGSFYLIELIAVYRKIQQLNTEMTILLLCNNKSVVDTINIVQHHTPSIKI
jgi:hypothetical protein